jgi:transcriptional regulator with XRE-family HTH domain
MADRGRPSEYDPDLVPQIVEMANSGLTDLEIAEEIGFSRTTLWRWRQVHPELCNALKEAKGIADARVEQSLYAKALGGDTTACIFWLKNRKSQEWRDKTDVTHSGDPDNPITVRTLNDFYASIPKPEK